MTGREFYEEMCKTGGVEASWEGLGTNEKMLWMAVASLAHQQAAVHGGLWSGMMSARKGKRPMKIE